MFLTSKLLRLRRLRFQDNNQKFLAATLHNSTNQSTHTIQLELRRPKRAAMLSIPSMSQSKLKLKLRKSKLHLLRLPGPRLSLMKYTSSSPLRKKSSKKSMLLQLLSKKRLKILMTAPSQFIQMVKSKSSLLPMMRSLKKRINKKRSRKFSLPFHKSTPPSSMTSASKKCA